MEQLWKKAFKSNRKRKKPVRIPGKPAWFQGVRRLFVLAYAIAVGENDKAGIKNNKKVFSPKRKN